MKALSDYLARTNTTQTALARLAGVSQPTIAHLIKGVHCASADLLLRLSDITGLTIDELLADRDVMSSGKSTRGRFHSCSGDE